MFSDEILLELRELLRRVPLLSNTRVRYTRSALLLTANLPDATNNGLLIGLLFVGLLISLGTLTVAAVHGYLGTSWLGLLAMFCLLLLFGIVRVNNRYNRRQRVPPNFLVDAATRRITLPAPLTWWTTAARPVCRFEDVTRVEAKLIQVDSGYGEIADVHLDFVGGYPHTVLSLASYAVAQQLAAVLQRIIFAPDDAPAAPPEPPTAPTA